MLVIFDLGHQLVIFCVDFEFFCIPNSFVSHALFFHRSSVSRWRGEQNIPYNKGLNTSASMKKNELYVT